MTELLKISKNDEGRQLVSARELHLFLEVQTRFTDWFRRRVETFSFQQYRDYTLLKSKQLDTQGLTEAQIQNLNVRIDAAITIQMAKELCMVENNEKGRQARLYFIEKEEQSNNMILNLSRKDLALMIVKAEEEIERMLLENRHQAEQLKLVEDTISKQAPKVEYFEKVLQSTGLMATTQIAADLGLSANKLNTFLFNIGWQFKVNGTWVPSFKIKHLNYMVSRTYTTINERGETTARQHFYWTQVGRLAVVSEWKKRESKGLVNDGM